MMLLMEQQARLDLRLSKDHTHNDWWARCALPTLRWCTQMGRCTQMGQCTQMGRRVGKGA
jgi:hypothetical protein